MNKKRRTVLNRVLDDLRQLMEPIDKTSALQIIEQSQIDVSNVADEEQDALDNRPESLQWSAANDAMEENISDLTEAADGLEELAEWCEDADDYDYSAIKDSVAEIVNAIKQTIHR